MITVYKREEGKLFQYFLFDRFEGRKIFRIEELKGKKEEEESRRKRKGMSHQEKSPVSATPLPTNDQVMAPQGQGMSANSLVWIQSLFALLTLLSFLSPSTSSALPPSNPSFESGATVMTTTGMAPDQVLLFVDNQTRVEDLALHDPGSGFESDTCCSLSLHGPILDGAIIEEEDSILSPIGADFDAVPLLAAIIPVSNCADQKTQDCWRGILPGKVRFDRITRTILGGISVTWKGREFYFEREFFLLANPNGCSLEWRPFSYQGTARACTPWLPSSDDARENVAVHAHASYWSYLARVSNLYVRKDGATYVLDGIPARINEDGAISTSFNGAEIKIRKIGGKTDPKVELLAVNCAKSTHELMHAQVVQVTWSRHEDVRAENETFLESSRIVNSAPFAVKEIFSLEERWISSAKVAISGNPWNYTRLDERVSSHGEYIERVPFVHAETSRDLLMRIPSLLLGGSKCAESRRESVVETKREVTVAPNSTLTAKGIVRSILGARINFEGALNLTW